MLYLSMVSRVVVAFVFIVLFSTFLRKKLNGELVLARVYFAGAVRTLRRRAQNLKLVFVQYSVF